MGFSYFRKVLHKNPAPLFPPPPRGNRHSFPQLTCKFLEEGRGCVHIALYPARETPPVFPLPTSPLLSGLYLWPPDPQPVKPRPWLMESAPSRSRQPELPRPGEENTQNRHSNSRIPAAATEIFNSPLNSTEKANCQNPAIAPNTSQMLRFAPVFSHSLAFFIRRVSFFRYSLSRSKYIYNLSVSIRCLLDAYNTHSLTLSFSPL